MNSDSDWRTWTFADAPPARPVVEERLVLGRYALGERLAPGGGGVVWRARDELSGDPVVVKLVPAMGASALAAVRREVTALRWLRLPGVVRLLDDGSERSTYALVMEDIAGRPFPGLDAPVPWEILAPRAWELLAALEGVHRAGVMHRDLKPGNVLVTDAGRVVLLDFGLAHGQKLAPEKRSRAFAGTVPYAATEQFHGEATTVSDLFAVGVMLYQALSGRFPWEEGTLNARRNGELARPLLPVAPHVPAKVAALVDRLLSPNPADRPQTAAAVAEALGAPSEPRARIPDHQDPAEALMALFAGPDIFLHLREDATALVLARTGGDRAAMARLIDAWVGAGDAHWEGDRVAIDRMALSRLKHWDAFAVRLAAGEAPADLLPEVTALAQGLLDQGMLGEAAAVLDLGLGLARQAIEAGVADLADQEAELLRLAAITALGQESVPATRNALYAMGRAAAAVDVAEVLARLLHGVRAAERGEVDRALDLLDGLPAFADEELETWRQVVRVLAAKHIGLEAERNALGLLESWAVGHRIREARLKGWQGNLAYRLGRYGDSARLHRESAALKERPDGHLASLANAANATLEALDLDGATALLEDVGLRARELRHASYEALATWAQRAAAYRRGELLEPAVELVEAVALLDAPMEGMFAIQEASFAWRRGQGNLAVTLARRARTCFDVLGQREMAGLAEALTWAAQGEAPRDRVGLLVELARHARVPDFGVQILGLIRRAAPDQDRSLIPDVLALARSRPLEQWPARLDVLSFSEATGPTPGG